MPTTTINPINPGTQIHATEEAARLAAAAFEKATRAATEAQRVAAEAQTKAERERHQRRTAYLAELTRTYADNRDSLTTAILRATLLDVRSGAVEPGVAQAIAALAKASVALSHDLELDERLAVLERAAGIVPANVTPLNRRTG